MDFQDGGLRERVKHKKVEKKTQQFYIMINGNVFQMCLCFRHVIFRSLESISCRFVFFREIFKPI